MVSCPHCSTVVETLTVEKKQADIKPAWFVSCPDCETTLTIIEEHELLELTPLEP